MTPPRADYKPSDWENRGARAIEEGSLTRCVYCPDGLVEIEEVQEEPSLEGAGVIVLACEGTCQSCGRHVTYDYEPREA